MSAAQAGGNGPRLSITNTMAGADFVAALDQHVHWGIADLDLRDGIAGKWLADVTLDEAVVAAKQIAERELSVYCLSSVVFDDDIGKGREHFTGHYLSQLDHVLELAPVFRPTLVRLIAAKLDDRGGHAGPIDAIEANHGWVFEVYREAIDRIAAAGFKATIENEFGSCILSSVEDFQRFFSALDREGDVSLTWDVQNQWATGVPPSVEVYQGLREVIGYYHVKGGKVGDDGRSLGWNVALEEADWPVLEITRRVIADGVSPVICLNAPAHGKPLPDYEYGDVVTERDLAYLRTNLSGGGAR